MMVLAILLAVVVGGGLVALGGWGMARILGLHVPSTEEIDAAISDALAKPFEQLDEMFGIGEDSQDD